ncbi:hypothetical protein ACSMXM_11855 [Pacificimonas sp. ICDLI1SI03]
MLRISTHRALSEFGRGAVRSPPWGAADMSRIALFALLPLAGLSVSSCADPRAEEPLDALIPVADVAPENCVAIQRVRRTHVLSDYVIDFEMAGGEIWRNELPNRCPGLGFEESFSYTTSLSQICSTDIIRVVRQGGGNMPGASCGLGQFRKMTPAPDAATNADADAAEE